VARDWDCWRILRIGTKLLWGKGLILLGFCRYPLGNALKVYWTVAGYCTSGKCPKIIGYPLDSS
jgi:hypothetical protein